MKHSAFSASPTLGFGPFLRTFAYLWLFLQVTLAFAQPYVFDREIGRGIFSGALDVAVDGHGHVIVVDSDLDQYFICDPDGDCDAFGGPGSEPGQFDTPFTVAVSANNRIFIGDLHNHRVQSCDHSGICEDFDLSGPEEGASAFDPYGIAVDSANRVIVSDFNNGRIIVCPRAGGNCSAFGTFGPRIGQFVQPLGLSVDGQDRIFITDNNFSRVQICDRFGDCQAVGLGGQGEYHFRQAAYIETLSNGVFAVSENNSRVILCTERAVCRTLAQADFLEPDPSYPEFPQGITEDDQGQILLADYTSVRFYRPNVTINPAMSVGTYNSGTAGQGALFHVFQESGTLFGAWFTFDTERPPEDVEAILGEPGQRWLTLQGPFEGNTANVDVYLSRGGVFDSADPPVEPAVDVGDATVVWDDCTTVTLTYDLTDPPVSGVIEMKPLVDESVPLCIVLSGDP